MSGFTVKHKQERQKWIDEYLSASGRNLFIPGEFVDWLSERQDHPAYPLVFGKDDNAAAREYRIDLVRRMASGLRITVTTSTTNESSVVSITTREYPSLISPVSGRQNGGGYVAYDATDSAVVSEFMTQGINSLRTWLLRYRGVFEEAGHDLSVIDEIVRSADAVKDVEVA